MTLGFRAYPPYTTVEAVRAELPPRLADEELLDKTLWQYINTAANRIDAELSRYYHLPAPSLSVPGGDPLVRFMPAQLEVINRYLAVDEAFVFLRDLRADEESNKTWWRQRAEEMLQELKDGKVILTYPFLGTDGRPKFVPLADGSPLYAQHPLSATSRVTSSFPKRTFTRETTNGWDR